jgi:hypothetical protein
MHPFLARGRVAACAVASCVLIGVAAPATTAVASPILTGTDAGAGPLVKSFEGATEQSSFLAYGPSFTGGVRVAAGDVNGDGRADYFTGVGSGAAPHVKVFDGLSGGEVHSFFAYDPAFTGGVFVAAGDVNGDGRADVVTGTGAAATHVKAFDGITLAPVHSFFAFPGFTGGVRVAAGDVNGDGRADLVAGTGAGGGHVKVFDAVSGAEVRSFFPYDSFTGGVFVAAGDVNGDSLADLITGTDSTGAAAGHVKVFDGQTGGLLHSFLPFGSFTGGVRVAAGDVNGDGFADIITGTGAGGGHVRVFDARTLAELSSFLPYGSFTGGVFVGGESLVPEPAAATLMAAIIGVSMLRRRRARVL